MASLRRMLYLGLCCLMRVFSRVRASISVSQRKYAKSRTEATIRAVFKFFSLF